MTHKPCQAHGRRKAFCLECRDAGVPDCGASLCQAHGSRKDRCKACREAAVPGTGSAFCEHGLRKARCDLCRLAGVPGSGTELCEHGVYNVTCPICCKSCEELRRQYLLRGMRKRKDLATVLRAPDDVCVSQAQQLNVVAAARGEDDLGGQRPRSRSSHASDASSEPRSVRSKSPRRHRFWQPQVEVLLTCGHTRWQARRCRLSRKTRPVPEPCGVYYQNARTASGRRREVAVCVQCGWQPRAPQSQAPTDGQALMLELMSGVHREARPGDDDEFGAGSSRNID